MYYRYNGLFDFVEGIYCPKFEVIFIIPNREQQQSRKQTKWETFKGEYNSIIFILFKATDFILFSLNSMSICATVTEGKSGEKCPTPDSVELRQISVC